MERKILDGRFYFFPGIYLTPGANKTAFVDISNGEVHRVQNDLLKSIESGELEEFEKAGLGLIITGNDSHLKILSKDIKFPTEDGLKIQVLERVDFIKYIEMPIRDIDVFYLETNNIDNDRLEKTLGELGYSGSYQVHQYNPEICPYSSLKDGPKIIAYLYLFYKKYNPCWGLSLSIDKLGNIKPCLWSDIVVGNLDKEPFFKIKERLSHYWELTKDKVDTCKECELKFVCSDCRVLANKINGSIQAKTPGCNYSP